VQKYLNSQGENSTEINLQEVSPPEGTIIYNFQLEKIAIFARQNSLSQHTQACFSIIKTYKASPPTTLGQHSAEFSHFSSNSNIPGEVQKHLSIIKRGNKST